MAQKSSLSTVRSDSLVASAMMLGWMGLIDEVPTTLPRNFAQSAGPLGETAFLSESDSNPTGTAASRRIRICDQKSAE